jgi:hypothetical protein
MNEIVLKTAGGEIFTTSLLIADKFGEQPVLYAVAYNGLMKIGRTTRLTSRLRELNINGTLKESLSWFLFIPCSADPSKAESIALTTLKSVSRLVCGEVLAELPKPVVRAALKNAVASAPRKPEAQEKDTQFVFDAMLGDAVASVFYLEENQDLTIDEFNAYFDSLPFFVQITLARLLRYNTVLLGAGIGRDDRKEKLRRRYCETRRVLEQAA